jgi:hypothetical protein
VSDESSPAGGGFILKFSFHAFRHGIFLRSQARLEKSDAYLIWIGSARVQRAWIAHNSRARYLGRVHVGQCRCTGSVILETLRSVLDKPEHAVLEQIG